MRIKKLKLYKYKPDNAEELIAAAEEAVEACKNYAEYNALKAKLTANTAYIRKLPKSNQSKKPAATESPAPQATQTPLPTEFPQDNWEN